MSMSVTGASSPKTIVVKDICGKETQISINKETTYYAIMEAYAKSAGVPIEGQRMVVRSLLPLKLFQHFPDWNFEAMWYYKDGSIQLQQEDGRISKIATKTLPKTTVLSDKVISANNWCMVLKLV